MECVALDIEGRHLLVGDLDTLWVVAGIQFTSHGQPYFGRGGGDQFDHRFRDKQASCALQPTLHDDQQGFGRRVAHRPFNCRHRVDRGHTSVRLHPDQRAFIRVDQKRCGGLRMQVHRKVADFLWSVKYRSFPKSIRSFGERL